MKNQTPITAIRQKCIDCCCGSRSEVSKCPAATCPLHPYRHGCRPETAEKRGRTAEQKPEE